MTKVRLYLDDSDLNQMIKGGKNFGHLTFSEYWLKRLQFWKYKKHRTMGRPILMLRKQEN